MYQMHQIESESAVAQSKTALRDAPLDIGGGGGGAVGLEFLLLANFFFSPPRENNLFLAINVRQFLFYVSSKNFFVVCFPYYIGSHLVFLCLVNIFFINFGNKLFSSAHIFNKHFFSDFCGDKLFFSNFF